MCLPDLRSVIRSDPHKTQERIARLDDYIRGNLLSNGSFICGSFDECRASRSGFPFFEGQMSHVGKHYDLEVHGRPTRIVIVGQECGHGPKCIERSTRSKIIVAGSGKGGFRKRNPHMKGTTSLLRLLLGREPGYDEEGERLLDGHIFDGFALVNYLLCTALERPRSESAFGGGKGHSSETMRRNCASHFLRTLEILEPTVIVAQGKGVRAWIALAARPLQLGPMKEIVEINGKQVDLLTFAHPSAGGSYGFWGNSLRSKYLRESVRPTIRSLLSRPR